MTLPVRGYQDWRRPLFTNDIVVYSAATSQAFNTVASTGALDMRQFASFTVFANVVSHANATAFNPQILQLNWSILGGVNPQMSNEYYGFFAHGLNSVPFFADNGLMSVADNIHGPFLNVSLFQNGVDTCDAILQVVGQTRTLGGRSVRSDNPFGTQPRKLSASTLVSLTNLNLAGGATSSTVMRLAPGRASARFATTTQGGFFEVVDAEGSEVFGKLFGAGIDQTFDFSLPNSSCIMKVTNTSGVAAVYVATVTSDRNDW